MGYTEWACLLLGVIIVFLLRLLLPSIANKTPIVKTAKTRGFLFFVCNLAIVVASLAIALYSLRLSAGGNTMTTAELSRLDTAVTFYLYFAWVLAGIALGTFILFVGEIFVNLCGSIKAKRAAKKEEEIRSIAYHIWEIEGRPYGRDMEHWLRAKESWEKGYKRIR